MKKVLLAILSGALLGAPFIVPSLWPLALIGLAPLLIVLTDEKLSARHAFGFGFLTGLVLYGIAVWAIFWSALPLDWLGALDPSSQVVFVALGWGMTVLGLALWAGIFALVFSRLADNSWRDVFTASALWVICEWLGAWWFGIQSFGPGSIMGPHASLAFIGNVLARDGALVQIAWLGGVYALSALAAGTGALLYRSYRANARERRMLAGAIVVLIAFWLVGHMVLARTSSFGGEERISIAAISTQQPAVPTMTREQVATSLDTFMRLLRRARGADIVAFPEGSDFLKLLREPAPARANPTLRSIFAGTTLPALIDSGNAYSSHGTLRSRVEVYDIEANTSAFEDKRFILSYGESMPAYVRAFAAVIGKGSVLESLVALRGLTPGNDTRPLVAASASLGVLFCDEAMSPVLYRLLAKEGARVFVNVSSHGWFHGSRMVADQMLNVSIVRAVESRRWYVQASDISPSFALDPYGRIATSTAWGTEGVLTVSVEPRSDITPYVRFGPWVLWCAFLTLLITCARSRRRV